MTKVWTITGDFAFAGVIVVSPLASWPRHPQPSTSLPYTLGANWEASGARSR
jgi:hypothetical protein